MTADNSQITGAFKIFWHSSISVLGGIFFLIVQMEYTGNCYTLVTEIQGVTKMRNHFINRFLACGAVIAFAGGFCGCGSSMQEETINPSVFEQEEVFNNFSVEDYQKKMSEDRILISECRENYENEIDEIRKSEYRNMDFENCEFSVFPEAEQIEVLAQGEHGISAQESWDTLEDWLESIGKQGEVDMETEARIVTHQFEWKEYKEFPYNYPSLYEHLSELASGAGAFIDTQTCQLQLSADGMYSMSNGKITEYLESLGYESKASRDWDSDDWEIVETGTLPELGEKKYRLLGEELTVQEGADMAIEYFEAGTPFPFEDGVTIDIPEATVFKLGDTYVYGYVVRRIYKGLPFAYGNSGGHYIDTSYMMSKDGKDAYVIDNSGVAAFVGRNESAILHTLMSANEMIGLKDAVEYLNQNLASYLKIEVEHAELAYVGVYFLDIDEEVIFPFWHFEGINLMKKENIWIYVDVFTGKIYYHTDDIEE